MGVLLLNVFSFLISVHGVEMSRNPLAHRRLHPEQMSLDLCRAACFGL